MKKKLAALSVAAALLLSACSIIDNNDPIPTTSPLPEVFESEVPEETEQVTEAKTEEPQPTEPEITEPETPEYVPTVFSKEELESGYLYLSGDEQFLVSKNKNIITLILDAADTQYVTKLLKNNPSAFEGLEDFTLYTNTCSVFDSTFQSMTQIYSGFTTLPTYGVAAWNEDAWGTEMSKEFYNRFHKAGYKMNFFVDADWELRHLLGRVDSVAINDEPVDGRDFYHVNYGFADKVDTLTTAEDDYNYFIVQHLWGAHKPIDMDTFPDQMEYLFNIMKDYLDMLKELGVYEDATIIIMGDHGSHDLYNYPDSTPLFMIKEPGAHHETIKATTTPIYFTDLMATYLVNAGLYNEETDKELFGSSIYDFDENSVRERTANYRSYNENYPYSPKSPLCHAYGYNVIYSYTYTGNSMNLLKEVNDGNCTVTWMEEDAA